MVLEAVEREEEMRIILICLTLVLMAFSVYADTAEDYFNTGKKYYYQQDYDKALEYFQKSFQMQERSGRDPFPVLYMNIGACYLHNGNYTEAEEYLKKAIKRFPDAWTNKKSLAYSNLGVVYFKKGDFNNAVECQKKAIQLDPNNENANKNLAAALKRLDQE